MPEENKLLSESLKNGIVKVCEGEVRWVPLSSMQAGERRLQQRYSIATFKDGKMVSSQSEWRDVPLVNE